MDIIGNKEQIRQGNKYEKKEEKEQWMIMQNNDHGDNDDDDKYNTSSSYDNSSNISTSSSSDVADDASSPTSTSSSSNSSMFELSELMANLPIKRGLSSFYQGKSQSFTSLASVATIEDLPKKENPYRRKMKGSKSYGNGLDSYKPYTLPKAIISKKVSRGGISSLSSLSFPSRRGSFLNSSKPPLAPISKKV